MPFFRLLLPILLLIVGRVCHAASTPDSFAYVLQADALADTRSEAVNQLKTCGRDWLILDAAFDGTAPWTRAELDQIRSGKPGWKVIAYLSIGEAEDYRSYWQSNWSQAGKLTGLAPSWLMEANPDWEGNYRVRYWDKEWQVLILAAIDTAMNSGFDGLYLDIVDGFETFERDGDRFIDDRINPVTKRSFRRDMVDWVLKVAARARRTNSKALIIPQNGSQLLMHDDFLSTISAIGIEDLFTDGDSLQPQSHLRYILSHLQSMAAVEKPVLLIEYCKKPKLRNAARKFASENEMLLLVTDRELTTLGKSGQ